jgi:hypothetical protein
LTARDLFTVDTSPPKGESVGVEQAVHPRGHPGASGNSTPAAGEHQSNPEAVPFAGGAETLANAVPSSGCCGGCGEWTQQPNGMGRCPHSPDWRTFSARSSCAFEPARWVALTPERQARREAQAGIELAADAADRAVDGWTAKAFEFIKRYAEAHRGRTYIGHDIVQASLATDLPQPPNAKAWGKPIQRAAREGVIRRAHGGTGAAPDPNRHGNLVPLWETP